MTPTENPQTDVDPSADQTPEDEQLRQLDEDRYVVTPESADSTQDDTAESDGESATDAPPETEAVPGIEDLDGHFALVAAARTGNGTESVSIDANDVSRTFEDLLWWYADVIAEDTPPEDVIDVLLAHADFDRSPTR